MQKPKAALAHVEEEAHIAFLCLMRLVPLPSSAAVTLANSCWRFYLRRVGVVLQEASEFARKDALDEVGLVEPFPTLLHFFHEGRNLFLVHFDALDVVDDVIELLGADVFTGISLTSCQLYVPAGSKTKYAQKAQWGDFKGSNYDNIVEYGSSVKVRNTIRKYGEDNPKFVYVVSGDPITGEPVLSCEATRTTPAGKYPVTISLGTITDENVELFDGYIVIQKVNATATVENATREAGQPNPEFSLVFDGLVNDEVVPVWLEEPVFTCEADENSPEGEYPITVTATAESYKLTFVAGTLTVTSSTTGIVSVNADAKAKSDVIFDLSGRRVSESAMNKGLYIRNGKKLVRK